MKRMKTLFVPRKIRDSMKGGPVPVKKPFPQAPVRNLAPPTTIMEEHVPEPIEVYSSISNKF